MALFDSNTGQLIQQRLFTLRTKVIEGLNNAFQMTLDTSSASVFGVLAGLQAKGMEDVWSAVKRLSDSMDPTTATDDDLINWGVRKGIIPKPATAFQTNKVKIWNEGTGNQTLNAGEVLDVGEFVLVLQNDVIVSDLFNDESNAIMNGVWTAYESASDPEPLVGLRVIENNPSGSSGDIKFAIDETIIAGSNDETMDAFRIRLARRRTQHGEITDQSLYSALDNIVFTDQTVVLNNRTLERTGSNRPSFMEARSFEAVLKIVGGLDSSSLTSDQKNEILNTIMKEQPAGTQANDPRLFTGQSIDVIHKQFTESGGYVGHVYATIAKPETVHALVVVGGMFSESDVKRSIVNAFGDRVIGETVYSNMLGCELTNMAGVEHWNIYLKTGSAPADPTLPADYDTGGNAGMFATVDDRSYLTINPDNITVAQG